MIFAEIKVAQMAAYFLQRRGGRMAYLKLMKLLYLADREALDRYSSTISEDAHYSMPQGPVLSRTLNLMTGQIESSEWSSWIAPCANFEVALNRQTSSRDDFDELSESEIEILENVWERFGQLDRWQLVDYTHAHIPEWRDPHGSSVPIDPRATFLALGRSPDEAEENAKELRVSRSLGRVLAEYQ